MATTESAERSGRVSRARIIEIAFEHFAAHGYRGASLGKIASEVGISQPGLLHHFPNKAALLQAVLLERDQRDLAAAAMAPEDIEQMELDGLLDFMERIVKQNAENQNSRGRQALLSCGAAASAWRQSHTSPITGSTSGTNP